LETACTQIKACEQDVLTRDPILSINVSAKQFRQVDFVANVKEAVLRHAINPERLKLELTESMLLENIEDIINSMNLLKEFGVRFSLDDFGTGYSSLQHLKQLPIDLLKIDPSFVRHLATDNDDKAIVRTIIAMPHGLKLLIRHGEVLTLFGLSPSINSGGPCRRPLSFRQAQGERTSNIFWPDQ
jgi:EAL domain-containing protein (putative c-di-GMP-specific phosphodiesterase class I)